MGHAARRSSRSLTAHAGWQGGSGFRGHPQTPSSTKDTKGARGQTTAENAALWEDVAQRSHVGVGADCAQTVDGVLITMCAIVGI